MPLLHTEFCYPRKSLQFQESLLATVTSLLDRSWMLSGGSIIIQDFALVVGKLCHSYSSKTSFGPWVIIKSSGSAVSSQVDLLIKWICCARVVDRTPTPCTSKENAGIDLTALELRISFILCYKILISLLPRRR